MKHYRRLCTVLFLCSLFHVLPKPVMASCGLKSIGNTTITDSVCSIDTGTVEGADIAANESSTSNTSVLTLSNTTITINTNATLAVGSIEASGTTSSIVITASGASFMSGNGIWITDGDADGWAASFTLYTATASGKRRLGLMRSSTTADCGDAAYDTGNTCTCAHVGQSCMGANCCAGEGPCWQGTCMGSVP